MTYIATPPIAIVGANALNSEDCTEPSSHVIAVTSTTEGGKTALDVNIAGASGGGIPITGPVTVVQPTASLLNVDVGNFPSTQNVDVLNFPATQPISGTVTVVQPSGANLHVDVDNFPATQPISGTVAVSNFPATQPISGTVAVSNFPATQPISGTVTANQGTANTLANAWPVEVTDGTNVLGTATHPVRTDPTGTTTQPVSGTVAVSSVSGNVTVVQPLGTALHVDVDNFPATQAVSGTVAVSSVSGNVTVVQPTGSNLNVDVANFPNPLPIEGSAVTVSGSIAGNGNILQLPNGGVPSLGPFAGITLEISGTWNSTLTLMGSNGGVYYTIDVVNLATPNLPPQSTITANGLYYAPIGTVDIQLVSSGYVSGTVICYASLRSIPPTIVDPFGSLSIPTYSIGVVNASVVTGATDVLVLAGSATKTVKIVRVEFAMGATTAVTVPVQLIKRSTANSGGTFTAVATTPFDSNNASATASNSSYTANATTLGTAVGTPIRGLIYFAESTVSASPAEIVDWTFGTENCQPIVLRGTSQSLAVNLNGTTVTGGKVLCSITWTEDNS